MTDSISEEKKVLFVKFNVAGIIAILNVVAWMYVAYKTYLMPIKTKYDIIALLFELGVGTSFLIGIIVLVYLYIKKVKVYEDKSLFHN